MLRDLTYTIIEVYSKFHNLSEQHYSEKKHTSKLC